MSTVLSTAIRIGLVLLLWMPLVVTPDTMWPFIVGKALYARGLIEIIAVLWLVLLIWDPTYRPRRSWVVLAFFAYLMVALLSAVWGVSLNQSLWSEYERMMGVWDLAHWFLLVLVAASVLRSPQQWRSLLNWNLGVALVLSLLALAQAYQVPLLPYLLAHSRLDATLGNPTHLATILLVTSLVAVGFLVRSFLPAEEEGRAAPESPSRQPGRRGRRRRDRRRPPVLPRPEHVALLRWRSFWATVAVLGLCIMFQTGTRGAVIGLGAGTIVMVVALAIWGNRRALKPVAFAAGGVFLAMTVLFALDQTVGFTIAPNLRQLGASARLVRTTVDIVRGEVDEDTGGTGLMVDTSIATRLLLTGTGLRGFLERPLLGWGPENYDKVFDRFADASFYRYTKKSFDQAHNKVVEELATKGILGTIVFLALWVTLVLAVVHRRRPPREEVLAYAVLGALAGYFVQNLFFFDTPAMMLQWVLLIAWVAGQERAPEVEGQGSRAERRAQGQRPWLQSLSNLALRAISSPWGRLGLPTAMVVLLGLSLYFLSYRPYDAARSFRAFSDVQMSDAQHLAVARKSFETFPGLATLPRLAFFEQLATQWQHLSREEKGQAFEVFVSEANRAFEAEPQNARLLMSALPLLQATFSSPEGLKQLEPLLQRLKELAPQRVQTYQRLATQELLKGNYRETIRIAETFESLAPETEPFFQEIKRAAEDALRGEEGG